jgi:4-amino-4-deoxy-L-arabinose transferase-like glycosyltransferase
MADRNWRLTSPPRSLVWLTLALILLVALFLRVYQLDRFPRGPFSDEAAAFLLASEVANGRSWPIFITSYTGHEVLFYYLASPVMHLLGSTVIALRLTSALTGAATVLVTYLLARELFDDEPAIESHWLGLLTAALLATSFWHISVSRYGYRAITLPLMQSLMLLALWRGLRLSNWRWVAAAGLFCGLVAYTYLSSRSVPVALAVLFVLEIGRAHV